MPKNAKDRKQRQTGRTSGLDAEVAYALNHPTRTEIIAVLNDRCASPSELSEILGIHLSSVSYHTRELRKLGWIEVVEQQQVRGAIKTKYRATAKMLLDTEHWERLSKTTRTGITINAVNEVIRRAGDAIERGTFDSRTDRSVITVKLDADDPAWQDIQAAVREAYERIEEIKAEAANRASHGAKTFRVTTSLLAYESPQEKAA